MLFKGKTTIELNDAKSGKLLQKTEDTNMVTKALEYFMEYGGITNPSIFYNSNLRTNFLYYMLGGVLCLDTAITESNEIVRVPAGVKMVANGARDVLNTGDPIELGSFNEHESGWQVDGSLKLVWDWTNSQGNGTIACVCLTSLVGGMQGIGNPSGTTKSNTHNLTEINSPIELPSKLEQGVWANAIGIFNDHIYTIYNSSYLGSTITLIKYSMPMESMDIRDTLNLREVDRIEINNPYDTSNYGSGAYRMFQNGKYAYLIVAHASTSGSYYTRHFDFTNNNPVYVYKFDLETETLAASYSLSPSSTGAAAISDLGGGVYPTLLCSGKYAVFSKYIFDLSDITNVTEIDDPTEDNVMNAINGDIAISRYNRLDLVNGERLLLNPTNGYDYVIMNGAKPLQGLSITDNVGSPRYIFRDPRFIATINNLDEPVVKTPDKTMKVTYTISFNNTITQ